jgi:Ankyrin repeats (3 copies)
MAENVLAADVLWWNDRIVRVRCPFCDKCHTHGHGSESRYGSDDTRMAHCPPLLSLSSHTYRLCFPFDAETEAVAFEINKEQLQFRTVGIEQEEDEVNLLAAEVESTLQLGKTDEDLPSLDSGTEVETMRRTDDQGAEYSYDLETTEMAVSNSILGEVAAVERYLQSSTESNIFLRGVDETGKTTLTYAAAERSPVMVPLLINRGAKVNHRSHSGRTPLMEASLWGRAENVRILLGHDADKRLRDAAGHTASDLAAQHNRNAEERYNRSGGKHQWYKEDTFNADGQRRMIQKLLEDKPAQSSVVLSRSGLTTSRLKLHKFHKSGPTASFILTAPVSEYPVPYQRKTVARLIRGRPFPDVDAMSGWGHSKNAVTISGQDWTTKVLEICQSLGHHLPADSRDRGVPGMFAACHAEMQLMAYFITKHVFLPNETDEDEVDDFAERNLTSLWRARPSVSLLQATILVSGQVCHNCAQFMRVVEGKLGISIALKDCEFKG